ncbi:ParA family protein [Vibrio cholerae]|uniref:ParA family protein n=1 Tax=Vibrio cholerae TaxID=666 RepID=A0A7Z7YDE4_VIBCL|nr:MULTISPECIES: ParA family protein [Vibrio]MDF4284600.1 ParA family protein [Vibrio parahaemolyticus]EJL6490531.1 ParA family protein [Vibrio cholerae]EJL6642222.1 ParA family protein [Vibrio cholerae]MBL4244052.1 ParA family protein [Vibrio fluvialis]MBL4252968.1 ParA family protein [Vibrio fluvialis]
MAQKKKPISIICYNHKGGVGKTFIASWLAYLFATGGVNGTGKKHRVVLVDLDSQQNSSKTFLEMQYRSGLPYLLPPRHPDYVDGDPDNGSWNGYSTSSDILFDRQFVYYPVKDVPNLKVLPSEGRVDRLNDVFSDKDAYIPLISELTNTYLEVEGDLDEVDIIVFDSPPSKTAITEGFMASCSHVIIPTQLEYDSVEAVPNLLETIRINNENTDSPINVVGVIPNLVRSSSLTNSELEQFTNLIESVSRYESILETENLVPQDFFLVNRVIFKPRRKPDNLEEVFSLKKDPKATEEMTKLYEFVCKRIGI